MKTSEVAPNVYVTESVAHDFLTDPAKWLEGHAEFPCKFVGGLHNLSLHDKRAWADKEDLPLRIIEIGTGREEVWFRTESKGPDYISLDPNGRLTSHLNVSRYIPTLTHEVVQLIRHNDHRIRVELSVWYQDDIIHRDPDKREGPKQVPALLSTKMSAPIRDRGAEYINSVYFTMFQEFWNEGEWVGTTAGDMTVIFTDIRLNTPWAQTKTQEWLAKHCQGGFFPFDDTLFGDEEEEFLFVADICARA